MSSNVDDRRGGGKGGKASLGIGGVIVVMLITWIMGGDPMAVLQNADFGSQTQGMEQEYQPSAEEEQMATFCKQILASTEDVWRAEFEQMGLTYRDPKLVLFTGSVQSGCGGATASVGPFYCSADESVYIDLSFFLGMRQSLGAGGDLAYAYVIAHEVGHHVQNLLGTLQQAHNKMAQVSEVESNQISVRLELQADYLAGLWVSRESKRFNSLEEGDIEEALGAASVIGDDYLQKKSRGYAQPETFNHGTSDQRYRWLRAGMSDGTVQQSNQAFTLPYSNL